MPNLRYAVVGQGRWGVQVANILREKYSVQLIYISRRKKEESKADYSKRVCECFLEYKNKVDVIWLAIFPSDQEVIIQCALDTNFHVVIEKPWMCEQEKTIQLIKRAKINSLQIGVHFQYCYLNIIREIKSFINPQDNKAVFSAEFSVSRNNRLELPALSNLASHLLAIKCLHFSNMDIDYIKSEYSSHDRRIFNIFSGGNYYVANFLRNNEPIIQRYISSFEQSITAGSIFPVNLKLALDVNRELDKLTYDPFQKIYRP